jgi:putative transposase
VGITGCEWLDEDPATLALSEDARRRRDRYREFVAKGDDELELKMIRASLQRGQPTGSDQFVELIESMLGHKVSKRGPGRPF